MVASLLVAIACGFCYGYDLSSLNTTHKEVKCWIHSLNNNLDYQQTCDQVSNGNYSSINLSNPEIISKYSLISSIAFGGAIVTAFLGGLLMDGLGRLGGQLVALILSLLGTILSGTAIYSNSYFSIVIGRLFSGLAIGFFTTITPVYLQEIAPKGKDGPFSMIFFTTFNFGVIFANVLGLKFILGTADKWQFCVLTSGILQVIGIVSYFFAVESPKWFVMRRKMNLAKKAELDLFGGVKFSAAIWGLN